MTAIAPPAEVPLTTKERAQWMLHRLVPGRGICNIGMAFQVGRRLRWWPLREALNQLIRRHPALRGMLYAAPDAPRKSYAPEDTELPLSTDAADESNLAQTLTKLVDEPFDIDGGLLVRANLLLLPESSVVCLVLHHLVADYTSAGVLIRELSRLYDSFAETEQPPDDLAPVAPIHLETAPDSGQVDYWVRHLAGVDPRRMALAGARQITGRPTFAGERIKHHLSDESVAAVRRIQRRTSATQNTALMAGFYLLLARHGAGPDLVVGVPVNGRRGALADVVGFHASTLPVRVAVNDDMDGAELVRRTSTAFLEGLENAQASFEEVQGRLALDGSGDWRVPLFRHMFNFRPPTTAGGATMAGAPLQVLDMHHGMSRVDLEWVVWPSHSGIDLAIVFSTEVHDRSFVEDLARRYEAVLVQLADRLDGPIGSVTARSAADEQQSLRRNDTTRVFPTGSVLGEIRRRADTAPDAIALRIGEREVAYTDLVASVERVRRSLTDHDIGFGDTVALLAPRGPELAAAALGVWAAGAAYLPLDPAHPPTRLTGQVIDSGARAVLVRDDPGHTALADVPGVVRLSIDPTPGGATLPVPEWTDPDPDACAYVIFTSGSTGRPKGVEVSHGAVANLVRDFAERLAFGAADRMLWLTTFAFDISGLELLLPLSTGGTVVVAGDADRADPDRLLGLVESADVTVVQATPTTWRHVVPSLAGRLRGRRVLCGGEPLDAALAENLLAGGCRLFNVYGPTETTIWSTAVELRTPVPTAVPIGEPLANTTVHVLTPTGRPVPPGVPGELCIAGAGVAIGYRGSPELTAQRFVDDQVLGRYYRTGDLVREVDGGLTFLGRLDRQVKVRGHRVELAEVEGVLAGQSSVRAAVVLVEPDGTGGNRLVAVLQPTGGGDEASLISQVHQHATEILPSGALPSRYVTIAELPLTANGKLDVRALRAHIAAPVLPVSLPEDPELRQLVLHWRRILGDDRLGPDANFFLCGGHSLLAGRLAVALGAEFGRVVEFDAIFDAPTPIAFQAWLAARPEAGSR